MRRQEAEPAPTMMNSNDLGTVVGFGSGIFDFRISMSFNVSNLYIQGLYLISPDSLVPRAPPRDSGLSR